MNPLLLLAAAAVAYALLMKDDKPAKSSGPTIPFPGGGSGPTPIVLDRDCYDENIPDDLRLEVGKLLAAAPADPNMYLALAANLRLAGFPKIAACLEQLAAERGEA
jgi:hypothetical protein